jgi:hypothetical protein
VAEYLSGYQLRFGDPEMCLPACGFESGKELLTVTPSCDAREAKRREQVPVDPAVGHPLNVLRDDDRWFGANAWDVDTPCDFSLRWRSPPPKAKQKALTLLKEVLERTTPAMAARRTPSLLFTAEAAGEQKAKAAAALWESYRPALETLMRLPSGVPRVVDASVLPRLTAGQSALALAYCPPLRDRGEAALYRLAFPDVKERVVEGPDVACPAPPPGWLWSSASSTKVGKRELRVASVHKEKPTADGGGVGRAVVLLVDSPTGRLLDWKAHEFGWMTSEDPTTTVRDCQVQVGVEGSVVWVQHACDFDDTPRTCKEDPMVLETHEYTVRGDKLSVQQRRRETEGKGCQHQD